MKISYKRPWLSRSTRKKALLLMPVLLLILVLSVYPVIRGILLGFCRYKVGKKIRFNGFDNYDKAVIPIIKIDDLKGIESIIK